MRACVPRFLCIYVWREGVSVLSMLRIAGSISVHNVSTLTYPSFVVTLPAGERALPRVDNVYTIFLRLPSS